MTQSQATDRLHALDAVRAFALLLGIFFHATMSFIDVEVESLNWAIADSSQSTVLILFVGVSHIFRMSLFFFIAGFFAHLMYHRRGATEFLRNRAVRIGIPFLVGWCIIAPSLRAIWHWGESKSGIESTLDLWPSAEQWSSGQVNLTHLWFLYYLGLIYILFVGSRHVLIDRLDPDRKMRHWIDAVFGALVRRHWAPVAFALPIAVVAIFAKDWNAATGMPTPDRSLIPEVIPMVGYGTVFALGWLFHHTPNSLQPLASRVKSSLWLALAAMIATSACGFWVGAQPTVLPYLSRFLAGLSVTALMWYINFSIIGYALRRFASPNRTTRYVADASYWLYIAHLPIVCALQVWVAHWPLHWTIKYPFIVAIAFTVLFASYHYLVRYSFIGAVLNGREVRHPEAASSADALA
jgi:peptidoglycan/LPS O-acetylase OafA/YrhL